VKFQREDVFRCDIGRKLGMAQRGIAADFTARGVPASEFKVREALARRGAYANVPRYNFTRSRAIVARAWLKAQARRRGKAA
jgi:hypothetical protein